MAAIPGHPKWGGRQKGTPNRRRLVRDAAKVVLDGDTKPMEVVIGTMREVWIAALAETDPDKRRALKLQACDLAEKAAPYCHPKLQAVHSTSGDRAKSHEKWLEEMNRAMAQQLGDDAGDG